MAVEGFHDARVQKFWEECQARLPEFTSQTPDVWAFGATPEQADALLELVLSGKRRQPRPRFGSTKKQTTRFPLQG